MLSEDSLKQISHIFCGDVGEYYVYKSGSNLWISLIDIIRGQINMGKAFHHAGYMYLIN